MIYAGALTAVGSVLAWQPDGSAQSASRVLHPPRRRRAMSRRCAAIMAVATLGSLATAFQGERLRFQTSHTRVVVPDAEEPAATGHTDPPYPKPTAARDFEHEPLARSEIGPATLISPPRPTAPEVGPPLRAATAALGVAADSRPSTSPKIARDADGAVLPSARRPGELPELITSNQDFYVVTKNAAIDPVPPGGGMAAAR